ncbi:MAG: pitrilysin family protein [Gemmatimonadaceae bacterium]
MSVRQAASTATVCLALVATAVSAQTLDRSKRPIAPPPAEFHFPASREKTLTNGLRVIVVEEHALPLVVVRVVFGVDSLFDPPGKEGLFALDTAMLREGTESTTPEQQAAATAKLGSAVSPLQFTTITENFGPSLSMMADMLIHPAFPATALERQKAALVAAAEAQRAVPYTIPRRVFFAKLLGEDHPLSRTVVSSPGVLNSFTRDDVVNFYDTYLRPNTTTLVIVGDVKADDAFAEVVKVFSSWSRGPTPPPILTTTVPPSATTIYLMDRPGVQQSLMFVGTLGPDRASPDFAALETMGPILGATPGSRLQQNIRERHAWMYSGVPAAVVWRRPPFPSMIYGSVPVATANVDSTLIEWIAELKEIGERAPTKAEMTLSRGALLGTLPAQIETDAGIADRVVFLIQNGLPLDYFDTYVGRVGSVTASEVLSAARRAVDVRKLVIVISGDRKAIEPGLKAANLAPVIVVDDNGKPIGR